MASSIPSASIKAVKASLRSKSGTIDDIGYETYGSTTIAHIYVSFETPPSPNYMSAPNVEIDETWNPAENQWCVTVTTDYRA